ncbi:MAG: glycoside hydrolase family 16 protein [Bacteroidetes bacterium]|nr:glycoside hydrolase family 16 protein [Bacteroidota bacterium]
MKYLYLLLFVGQASLCSCSRAQTPVWKLIWSDEFSKDGLPDASKWNFAGRGKSDWNCFCADDSSVAYVKNGFLYLKGIVSNTPADTAKYHTGCLNTSGKFSFQYGKLEVRAKLSQGQGSWPAIWLLGDTGTWPNKGEIDVMEHLNNDNIFYQTMHSYYIDILKNKNNPKYFTTAPFLVNDFNVFGMEWYEDRVDLFINGQKTFSYPKISGEPTGTQWPYKIPFYILLDQALGGNWPGPINTNDLPQQMVIDWVRVYQLSK